MPPPLISLFLIAHALIHLGFLSGRPLATAGGPAWPFDLDQSWFFGRVGLGLAATRSLGIGSLALVVAGFLVAAIAALGIGPAALFGTGVVIGSVSSAALLVLFFHRWLVLGLAIDAVLLWLVLATGWHPSAGS